MRDYKITVEIKLRWWFKYLYLPALIGVCKTLRKCGIFVDLNKDNVNYWFTKGTFTKVIK